MIRTNSVHQAFPLIKNLTFVKPNLKKQTNIVSHAKTLLSSKKKFSLNNLDSDLLPSPEDEEGEQVENKSELKSQ